MPGTAFAQKMSKELRAELTVLATQLKSDADPQARQAALLAFGRLGDKNGRKDIEAFKANDDARVRLAAGMGLVLAGDKGAQAYLVNELKQSPALYPVLREVVAVLPDAQETGLLREFVRQASPEARRETMRYLSYQRGALYELLGSFVSDKDAQLREAAMEALRATAGPHSAGLAKSLVRSKDADVRHAALALAQSMRRVPESVADATDVFVTGAADKTPKVAMFAARQLVELRHPKGTAILLGAVAREEGSARAELVRFLLEHNARPAIAPVRAMLAKSQDPAEKALLFELAAASEDEDMTRELLTLFRSDKFEERVLAVRALGRARGPEVYDAFAQGLFEGQPEIRRHSAIGLGQLADERGVGPLDQAIKGEKDLEIRLLAVQALGRIKSPNAVARLRFLVKDNDPQVRLAVVRGIRQIGLAEGAEVLNAMGADRSLEVQWQAFLTILQIKPEQGLKRLKDMLRNPPETLLADLEQLPGQVREAIYPQLLAHESESVRRMAVQRLMIMGDSQLGLLRKTLADAKAPADVRREILLFLGARADVADLATFAQLASEKGAGDTASLAAWALTRYERADAQATWQTWKGSESSLLRGVATFGLTK